MHPFDLEVWYGERVAVLGSNGSGKSQFLRLLAGADQVPHRGTVRLGARVVPPAVFSFTAAPGTSPRPTPAPTCTAAPPPRF